MLSIILDITWMSKPDLVVYRRTLERMLQPAIADFILVARSRNLAINQLQDAAGRSRRSGWIKFGSLGSTGDTICRDRKQSDTKHTESGAFYVCLSYYRADVDGLQFGMWRRRKSRQYDERYWLAEMELDRHSCICRIWKIQDVHVVLVIYLAGGDQLMSWSF